MFLIGMNGLAYLITWGVVSLFFQIILTITDVTSGNEETTTYLNYYLQGLTHVFPQIIETSKTVNDLIFVGKTFINLLFGTVFVLFQKNAIKTIIVFIAWLAMQKVVFILTTLIISTFVVDLFFKGLLGNFIFDSLYAVKRSLRSWERFVTLVIEMYRRNKNMIGEERVNNVWTYFLVFGQTLWKIPGGVWNFTSEGFNIVNEYGQVVTEVVMDVKNGIESVVDKLKFLEVKELELELELKLQHPPVVYEMCLANETRLFDVDVDVYENNFGVCYFSETNIQFLTNEIVCICGLLVERMVATIKN
jgi:hypothetical protein